MILISDIFEKVLVELGYSIIRVLSAAIKFQKKILRSLMHLSGKKIKQLFKGNLKFKRKLKPKKERMRKFPLLRIYFLGFISALFIFVVPFNLYIWFTQLPNPELVATKDMPTPSRILDREGRLLYEIYIDKRFDPIKLEQMPQYIREATIAVEDDQFYKHIGFDLPGILRAARETALGNAVQGGSTITQQLVKNVLLSPERTISRKVKELVLSVLVELRYTKDEILELYLNNISYGGSAWGIQSASHKFFGKDAWELSLAESSLLAGLPTAPTLYSPLVNDPEIAKTRQRYVLDRMQELGYITKDEADAAYNEELLFAPQVEYIRAPHFVSLVRKELENRYGRRFVEMGGLTITTTLDLDLQDKVQEIVSSEVEKNAWLNISNGAAVVMDVENRGLLAYVGSKDYFTEGWGAYDVASAYRQPGSSIKPLTYVLALEKGMTMASIVEDKPITYKIEGQPAYTPKNYDGKFHGKVTLRQALANSYNIPAVKIAEKVGPDYIVQAGKDFGLSNWEIDGSYGLSITLGGKEVRLVDHTNMFASFADYGKYRDFSPFISILDKNGFNVLDNHRVERQVVSPENAYILWNVLSDNNARIPAFGTNNYLAVRGKRVAVKTGTTDSIRDNLTMGYTPSYAVGVWVGNNDNTPLNHRLASGLSGAAPIWNKIMLVVLEDKPDEHMKPPVDVISKFDEKCGNFELFKKGSNIPSTLCPEDDKDKDEKKD